MSDLSHWQPPSAPTPVTLQGRYVTLEPLAAHHAESLWQATHGHDHLWTWLASGPYAGPTDIWESLSAWRDAEKAVLFAIIPTGPGHAADSPAASSIDSSTPTPYQAPGTANPPASPAGSSTRTEHQALGWASLMRAVPQHGVVEVGNVLFSPALQRTRAATEAMYLMAAHVFETLGYRRYEWKCNAQNEPSRRAAHRLGFTFEGIFRQHMVIRRRNRDTAWFSMLDHEWPTRKQAFESWLSPENFDNEGRQKRNMNRSPAE